MSDFEDKQDYILDGDELEEMLELHAETRAHVSPLPPDPPPSPNLVTHPPHYTSHPSGIECIEITRHMNFNLGNAMKYLWRAGLKGAEVQDLEKAVWYIEDEIKRLKS